MRWRESWRCDPEVRKHLADHHYNRQSVGARDFVPPGRCYVLRVGEFGTIPKAYWVTSWPYAEYVKHEWAGAWVCSAFRNMGAGLSSELILEAVAATLGRWPEPPALGMVSFVDSTKVRAGKPGFCYECAGFKHVGYTKENHLHAWQLLPEDMPAPVKLGQQRLMG